MGNESFLNKCVYLLIYLKTKHDNTIIVIPFESVDSEKEKDIKFESLRLELLEIFRNDHSSRQ